MVGLNSAMVEVSGLSKSFSDKKRGLFHAVNDVSFRCEAGRVYGLLGGNGAGKTTTLRMLATLLTPTRGRATIDGFDIVSAPQKVRARVGFLSGATALYGRLTAREMVEYFGALHGLRRTELRERVAKLFKQLDMEAFQDRRCDKLSTGMKQKVSIARTLIHDPPVMIFDEPTSGLDVLTARAVLSFIRQCRDRGKTVLFSTHIMTEATKLCDTVGVIHEGKLVDEGTVNELLDRHGETDLEEVFVKLVAANEGEGGNLFH